MQKTIHLLHELELQKLVVFLCLPTLQGQRTDCGLKVVNGELETVDFVHDEEILHVFSALLLVVVQNVLKLDVRRLECHHFLKDPANDYLKREELKIDLL